MEKNEIIKTIRQRYIKAIEAAVKSNNNCIEVFDCDDDEDIEDILGRIDTPVIVADTTCHECFGGVAIGHLTAIYFNPRMSWFKVTIKMENGEDFDASLNLILLEGLEHITRYLIELGFIDPDIENTKPNN